ncbi:MAG TPA: glycosyltransferase family 4 protein [Candidatus Saccharimonadia bacterium]|nr:glycosyltransferase family 4 protein [Candidatus Saccharimonadia bacterium]
MKILWLTWKDGDNPLAGGAEVVNEELAKRLAADGHEVTFVVGGFAGSAHRVSRDGYRIVRVGGRFTTYLAAWGYYRRHRAKLSPDLVIDECNTMPYFSAWYTGKPTLLFFHMLCRRIWFYEFPQPLSTIGWLVEPLYLRLLRRAPVVTVSESSKRDLMRQGFRGGDIHVISEGIELAPLTSLAQATKFEQPTLLSLGSIRPMKRTLDQITAFELAKRRRPDLRLVVAGAPSGRYGQEVLRRIVASPYAADIEYAGRVSPADKLRLMCRAHAILVTSVKEGWGLIVTEAASQGTPAIVYDVDGLRDSVRPGQTGLIAATNAPAALADRIIELLADPARYDQLREQAWAWSHQITFDRSYADFCAVLDGLPLPQTELAADR